MSELKPCPFCGGKATIKTISRGYGSNGFTEAYNVGCDNCKIYFKEESIFCIQNGTPIFLMNGYDRCFEIWNRRANNEIHD